MGVGGREGASRFRLGRISSWRSVFVSFPTPAFCPESRDFRSALSAYPENSPIDRPALTKSRPASLASSGSIIEVKFEFIHQGLAFSGVSSHSCVCMPVALYLRVSTEEQRERQSISNNASAPNATVPLINLPSAPSMPMMACPAPCPCTPGLPGLASCRKPGYGAAARQRESSPRLLFCAVTVAASPSLYGRPSCTQPACKPW
jgi:hypothetical protein